MAKKMKRACGDVSPRNTLSLISGTSDYDETNGLASPMNDILEVALRRNGTDFEVDRISRGEYLNIPNKTTTGRPSQFYFNRQTSPELSLWPTPDSDTDELVYYYITRIEDADTSQNTTDVPYRFLPCMIAGLAYYLCLKKAPDRVQLLKTVYEEEFQRAANEDEDRVSNPRPDRSESLTVFVYTDQIGLPEEGPRAVGRVGTVTIGGTVPSVDVDVPVTGASTTPAVGDVTVSVPTVALTFDSTDNTLDSTDNTFDEGVETESLTLDSTDSTFDSADNTFDEA